MYKVSKLSKKMSVIYWGKYIRLYATLIRSTMKVSAQADHQFTPNDNTNLQKNDL